MGEAFFGGSQSQIGKALGHTTQIESLEQAAEFGLSIDGIRHVTSWKE